MQKLSVVVSAYNEESIIKKCLESVLWADEIIFIDSSSSDGTVDIAKKYTSQIFTRPNNLMLNVNKNYGFTKAQGEWILSLDADEHITDGLKEEIKSVIASDNEIIGYWIPRKNIIFGKWIQGDMWWPDYQLRLFKKGKGRFPEKHVHEYIRLDGPTEKLREPFIHENYSSVSQFLYKMDKIYTESEVEHIIESGKKVRWVDALRFPINDFLKTFFLQKGYKNGLHGLVLSLLQALYMEVVFAKLWEKQGFQEVNNSRFLKDVYEEVRRIAHEFEYWFVTSFINDAKNPVMKIILKTARKIVKLRLRFL